MHHEVYKLLEPVFVCHLDRMKLWQKYISSHALVLGQCLNLLVYVNVAEHWDRSDLLGFPWFPADTNDLVSTTRQNMVTVSSNFCVIMLHYTSLHNTFFTKTSQTLVSFAAVIRVVTQRSSPLTAAYSSSAFLSLKLTKKEQASILWKPGLCRQM